MEFAFQSLEMSDSKAIIFNQILSLVLQYCLCFGVQIPQNSFAVLMDISKMKL